MEKYKVIELWVDNDSKMKIVIYIDVVEELIILEGYYKIKLNGLKNFKLFGELKYKLDDDNLTFQKMVEELYETTKKRVAFAETVMQLFENVDHIEIKKD